MAKLQVKMSRTWTAAQSAIRGTFRYAGLVVRIERAAAMVVVDS
jgi:hypothetical protein